MQASERDGNWRNHGDREPQSHRDRELRRGPGTTGSGGGSSYEGSSQSRTGFSNHVSASGGSNNSRDGARNRSEWGDRDRDNRGGDRYNNNNNRGPGGPSSHGNTQANTGHGSTGAGGSTFTSSGSPASTTGSSSTYRPGTSISFASAAK